MFRVYGSLLVILVRLMYNSMKRIALRYWLFIMRYGLINICIVHSILTRVMLPTKHQGTQKYRFILLIYYMLQIKAVESQNCAKV